MRMAGVVTCLLLMMTVRAGLGAAVIEGVRLVGIASPHVVLAKANLAGASVLLPVRLLYVRAPDVALGDKADVVAKASELMKPWARADITYTLWAPGEAFAYDASGRLLAVVWPAAHAKEITASTVSIQENLLATGYGCVSDEHGVIPPDHDLAADLPDTQQLSRKAKFGLWPSPPEWMTPAP